ncbi:hypothetical protein BRADI_3g14111v3 [Brachypodium distachyon]|uniref:Uncharacterized protein n=1 Tax=Brachypodium distachyon TaxID=15368 RepID=A0A2K2CX00_BRADI|nr:hypothetical protein BRADI_3g14111v3 [Brachypodium distachyon]
MVQRISRQEGDGEGREAAAKGRKKRAQTPAMAAIKRKVLRRRCSGLPGRPSSSFKRSYYLAGAGDDDDDASSAVFLYLACIACAPPPA